MLTDKPFSCNHKVKYKDSLYTCFSHSKGARVTFCFFRRPKRESLYFIPHLIDFYFNVMLRIFYVTFLVSLLAVLASGMQLYPRP